MKVEKTSVSVKGYKRKHKFTIEKTTMAGHTLMTVLKNDNPILKCTPLEFVKFKKLFCS